ncbi:MAG: DNA mismatch repair endonuclease MutL [Dehalococcoidales bacterium]|nr:DNA mismatch repair endonuclease MutL [Dehalococcoidales bacterium]
MSIRVLAPQIVSRIAAGEVVERPASVVKELVENSLDAGATRISVEVEGSGISRIRVTDNGSGIPPEEIELAFGRHATSKIGSLEDLDAISSLGFRGEALPSIAAAAEVELGSCAGEEPAGAYIRLQDGKVVEYGSRGHSPGTTVTVENLFRRIPVRLKFLRSAATENSHIANIVSRYALAYPEVGFTLSLDGRITLRTPGSGRLIDSIAQVYGVEIARSMLEIKSRQGESGNTLPLVTGMTGSPKVSRSSRDYLSLFVNRRWISHRTLAWAVEQAYHGLLMVGKHPVAIINISLPPGEMDVNVHPAKTEVKFRNEQAVFSTLQRTVRQTLIDLTPVPKVEEVRTPYRASPAPAQMLWTEAADGTGPAKAPPEAAGTPASSLPALRVIGQLSRSYIIAEGPDGLYIIDQHAAHERILFEQINDQRSQHRVETQTLLEPVPFDVTPGQGEVLKTRCENLARFGFSVEPFGEGTFLVRTVPAGLAGRDWASAIRELLDKERGQADWEERIAISIACHSAVRAGQVLGDDEMREIVRQLEQAAVPNSCPHGRPTMIHLSLGQLGKEFGRR